MKRIDEETVRAVMEEKLDGKNPRGRPRKGWIDLVEEEFWDFKNGRKLV